MKEGAARFRFEAEYRKGLMKYPILVLTHQGFMRRHQRLNEYVQWTDEDVAALSMASKVRNRTRLIVDEQPAELKMMKITEDSLNTIERHAQLTANYAMFEPIFEICKYIRSRCFTKPADLQTQYWHKCELKIPDNLDKYYYETRDATDEILNIYTAIKVFCVNGGFVNFSENEEFKNITIGKHIDFFDDIFDAVILDGSAKINTVYKHERFNIINLPPIKTYDNVSIHICNQLSGSKRELKIYKDDIIETLINHILETKPSDDNALIITMKEFEQKFLNIGLPPNTMINHFGNITGSNKYADCKYLYIVGIQSWPDNAYKIAYHIYSGDLDMNKSQESITSNGVRKMTDNDYRETRTSLIATELIQAINRVRCRRWVDGDTLKTDIFMLAKDEEIINLIEESMPGVKITDGFDFYEKLSKETKKDKPMKGIDAVLMVLKYHEMLFPNVKKVKKKDVFNKHEITENIKSKAQAAIWKHPSLKQLISDRKIKLHNHYVEFLV